MLYMLIAGAVLGIAVVALQGSIKLFTPRRHHLTVDRGFAAVGRALGRVLVIGAVIWVAVIVYYVYTAG